ncbi:hypothetical protein FJZ48_03840 [Candidatus Uhrbacteria bacterium]|nr:hypothetical protein [Candidatus Uhrbacteria bacterium]
MFPIFGLVGPSGSGKTLLIEEMLARWPSRLGVLKSLATRMRRGLEDDRYYDFVTNEEMRERITQGRLIQSVEFAGNIYGNDRKDVDALLKNMFGIMAIVEPSVKKFRDAGYEMILVKITPINGQQMREGRREADVARAKIPLDFAYEVTNAFEPGGKEKAIEALEHFLKHYLE